MAKETIGIEALLHRAYAQYRVDKVTPEAVIGLIRHKPSGSLSGAMQALALGTIVDNSGIASRLIGLQTMAAATPDDLLIVHDHVLALEEWLIEGATTSSPMAWRRSEIAAQGWRVEDTANGLWLVRSAGGKDEWSGLTNPYLPVLIIEHARAGSRPSVVELPRAGRGRPSPEALTERAEAMLSRAMYAVWHAALGVLVAELAGQLARHSVTALVAPAAPWEASDVRVITSERRGPSEPGNSTPAKTLKQHYNR